MQGETFDEPRDRSAGEILNKVLPKERVVWRGQPEPLSMARLSLGFSLFGLLFTAFAIFWIGSVAYGGHNNWDRGRAVPPFALHNVLVAVFPGGFILLGGLHALTSPYWAWRRAQTTVYALTAGQAIVIEPRFFGGYRVQRFSPSELKLMRYVPAGAGVGSLIFKHPGKGKPGVMPLGFLTILKAREIEALIRATLIP